jgi:hypothetical protein
VCGAPWRALGRDASAAAGQSNYLAREPRAIFLLEN